MQHTIAIDEKMKMKMKIGKIQEKRREFNSLEFKMTERLIYFKFMEI